MVICLKNSLIRKPQTVSLYLKSHYRDTAVTVNLPEKLAYQEAADSASLPEKSLTWLSTQRSFA